MPNDAFARVLARAENQHALVRRDQVLALVSPTRLHRCLLDGRLQALWPNVYRVPGAPRSPQQALLAAVWAAGGGAAAYGLSAAWLWGLVEEPPDRPQVVIPEHRRCLLEGMELHRSRALSSEAVVQRHRIPTVDPMLTMVHLGACLNDVGLADALARGLQSRFSMGSMWATLDRYGRPGRNGSGRLRRVVENRALEDKPPDSVLEDRCGQLFQEHGIDGWVFHHHVRDDGGRFVAEPDFAFVSLRLAVEVDGAGKLHHRGALDAFLEREHRLAGAGWQVVRFTWAQVVRRPGYVIGVIRERLRSLTFTP